MHSSQRSSRVLRRTLAKTAMKIAWQFFAMGSRLGTPFRSVAASWSATRLTAAAAIFGVERLKWHAPRRYATHQRQVHESVQPDGGLDMADVQVNQSPSTGTPQPVQSGGGGSGAAWAVVVIVLLAIIAWFVFGRGMVGDRDGDRDINIDAKIETPAPAPATPPPATPPPAKSP